MALTLALLLVAAPASLILPEAWQPRFALKASEPTVAPAFTVTGDAAAGFAITKRGRATGTVYLGAVVRLPQPLPPLELAVEYQTFCNQPDRSGEVRLLVLSRAVWEAIATDPRQARVPPTDLRLNHLLHRNRTDVTEWTIGGVDAERLREALEPVAGQEVVVAVAWNCWHPSDQEWARLRGLWLGPARPRFELVAPPRVAYRGEPVEVTVLTTGDDPGPVAVQYRAGGEWATVTATPAAEGRFRASVPAPAGPDGLVLRAVRRRAGEAEQTTGEHKVSLVERPIHPNLLYNAAELTAMKAKVARYEWARTAYDSLLKSADDWVASTAEPPLVQGGWSHDYSCPDCGARLQFRLDHPHDHWCPTCQKALQGPKYDATWVGTIHGRFSGAANDLALAGQLTGDDRYGRAAARIILWYADHYAQFPLGKGPAGKGKVHSQSLTECGFLLSLFQAADLAWPVLTSDERRRVENQLVRAGAEHVRRYTFGIHNIQCWHNACVGVAGYFLGDPELIRAAREGDLGFDQQVARGIMPDGTWFERSLGYHNYTLSALIWHCEAARHAGEPLHRQGRIQQMFTLPLRLAQPNLVPPSLNDQGYTTGPIAPDPLERAWAWYQDETALQALRKLYGSGRARGGRVAWQYGEDLPPGGAYLPPPSEDLPGAGLAVLRHGAGDAAACAMLEYGEHGGGHGHPDKLQLILYGLGRTLLPDPGTTGYGSPLHANWYKTTVAHNTVVIGQQSQKATTGKLLDFHVAPDGSAAVAEATGAYPGYRLVRRLLLTDGVLVDTFAVAGEEATTLDWFAHAGGALTTSVDQAPVREEAPNRTYGYLTELQAAAIAEPWTATWQVGEGPAGRLHVWVAGEPGTQVLRCLAPGLPGGPKWPTLRVRRHAASTTFVAVWQLLPAGQEPRAVALTGGELRVGPLRVHLGTTVDAPLRATLLPRP